jgi:hypothetical protein
MITDDEQATFASSFHSMLHLPPRASAPPYYTSNAIHSIGKVLVLLAAFQQYESRLA